MCCALLDLVSQAEPHLRSLASETVLEELLTIMCKNFRCFCPVLCSLSANRGSPPSWVEQRLLQSTRCLLSLMTTNSPRGRLYNTASLCRLPCQKSWRLNLCGVWLPHGFDYRATWDFCSCCCSTLSQWTTNSTRGRLYNTASLCRLPCQKSWRLNLCGVWLPHGFDYRATWDFCSCCCSTLSQWTTNSTRGRLYNTASLCRLPCQKSWRLNLCGVWLPRGFDYWAMSDFCSCCCSTGEGRSPENRVATPAKRGTPLPPSYQGHREAWESVQRYAPSFKQWDPDFHPYTLHLWNSHTLEIFLICHTSTFAAHVGWRSMKA